MNFIDRKYSHFYSNLAEFWTQRSIAKYSSIGSENGLELNWRQAVIWNNGGPVYCRIYALIVRDVSTSYSSELMKSITMPSTTQINYTVWAQRTHICDLQCVLYGIQFVTILLFYRIITTKSYMMALQFHWCLFETRDDCYRMLNVMHRCKFVTPL